MSFYSKLIHFIQTQNISMNITIYDVTMKRNFRRKPTPSSSPEKLPQKNFPENIIHVKDIQEKSLKQFFQKNKLENPHSEVFLTSDLSGPFSKIWNFSRTNRYIFFVTTSLFAWTCFYINIVLFV